MNIKKESQILVHRGFFTSCLLKQFLSLLLTYYFYFLNKSLYTCTSQKNTQYSTFYCTLFIFQHTQVDDFVSYVMNMSQAYNTRNVIITMGEDFNYQSAHMWFKNLDKLIK